jgi:4-amino-4-deoxy-L-arabinose transferase-like glycosyltransferase
MFICHAYTQQRRQAQWYVLALFFAFRVFYTRQFYFWAMIKNVFNSGYFKTPWIAFSPFLALYVIIVVALRHKVFDADAGTYIMYAQNLAAGHYAPRDNPLLLWCGPGYPLLLAPLMALGVPTLAMILLNAVFRYLSIVFVYKTARLYASPGLSFAAAALWGLHFTTYEFLPNLNTETLAILMTSLLAYAASRAFQSGKPVLTDRHIWLAGLALGYLTLTKIIFGYVLAGMLVFALAGLILSRAALKTQKAVLIVMVAYLVTAPYLAYTYQQTGRFYYWGNSGGLSLYWMSTPYEHEYGDWQSGNFSEGFKGRNTEAIRQNHAEDYKQAFQLDPMASDDFLKERAIQNIKENPGKYFVNCVANTSRLLFGFPNSFQYENLKFFKMFPNFFILVLILYSLFVSMLNIRRLRYEVVFLATLAFIYLGLSVLVSAFPRMFLVIVPALLTWIVYVLDQTVTFRLIIGPAEAHNPRRENPTTKPEEQCVELQA